MRPWNTATDRVGTVKADGAEAWQNREAPGGLVLTDDRRRRQTYSVDVGASPDKSGSSSPRRKQRAQRISAISSALSASSAVRLHPQRTVPHVLQSRPPRTAPLAEVPRAQRRLCLPRRLHGGRRRRRAGGPRQLWGGDQAGLRRPHADPLPPAASPHDAVRDGRDQAARPRPDGLLAAVDSPPHGERQRVQHAVLGGDRLAANDRAGRVADSVGLQSPGERRVPAG